MFLHGQQGRRWFCTCASGLRHGSWRNCAARIRSCGNNDVMRNEKKWGGKLYHDVPLGRCPLQERVSPTHELAVYCVLKPVKDLHSYQGPCTANVQAS
eukprot:2182126-Prymnesium_polylepis.2